MISPFPETWNMHLKMFMFHYLMIYKKEKREL